MAVVGVLVLFLGALFLRAGIKNEHPISSLIATLKAGHPVTVSAAAPTAAVSGASGTTYSTSASTTGADASTVNATGASAVAVAAVAFAESQKGTPYSEAAGKRLGPDFYDCSGLVYAAYKEAGVNIGATFTGSMMALSIVPGSKLVNVGSDPSKWLPGDILMEWGVIATRVSHCQLFIGGGNVVESSGIATSDTAQWPNGLIGVRDSTVWTGHVITALRVRVTG